MFLLSIIKQIWPLESIKMINKYRKLHMVYGGVIAETGS